MAINLTKTEKAALTEQAAKFWNTPSMIEHVVKTTSAILTVRERMITFQKPRIRTDFYFAERGHDFDEVNEYASNMSRNEMYFIMENMAGSPASRVLQWVEEARGSRDYIVINPTYTGQGDDCTLGTLIPRTPRDEIEWEQDRPRALTSEELDKIEAVALAEQTKFEKRLMTYLKRYGLTKCNFQTFWADR